MLRINPVRCIVFLLLSYPCIAYVVCVCVFAGWVGSLGVGWGRRGGAEGEASGEATAGGERSHAHTSEQIRRHTRGNNTQRAGQQQHQTQTQTECREGGDQQMQELSTRGKTEKTIAVRLIKKHSLRWVPPWSPSRVLTAPIVA